MTPFVVGVVEDDKIVEQEVVLYSDVVKMVEELKATVAAQKQYETVRFGVKHLLGRWGF